MQPFSESQRPYCPHEMMPHTFVLPPELPEEEEEAEPGCDPVPESDPEPCASDEDEGAPAEALPADDEEDGEEEPAWLPLPLAPLPALGEGVDSGG